MKKLKTLIVEPNKPGMIAINGMSDLNKGRVKEVSKKSIKALFWWVRKGNK